MTNFSDKSDKPEIPSQNPCPEELKKPLENMLSAHEEVTGNMVGGIPIEGETGRKFVVVEPQASKSTIKTIRFFEEVKSNCLKIAREHNVSEEKIKHIEELTISDRIASGNSATLSELGHGNIQRVKIADDFSLDIWKNSESMVGSTETQPGAGESNDPNRHSPDFRSVNINGMEYTFTAGQAACVKILWEAYENHTPEVGQETLLEKSGSAGNRLRDVFKDHSSWQKFIIEGTTKGTFKLNFS